MNKKIILIIVMFFVLATSTLGAKTVFTGNVSFSFPCVNTDNGFYESKCSNQTTCTYDTVNIINETLADSGSINPISVSSNIYHFEQDYETGDYSIHIECVDPVSGLSGAFTKNVKVNNFNLDSLLVCPVQTSSMIIYWVCFVLAMIISLILLVFNFKIIAMFTQIFVIIAGFTILACFLWLGILYLLTGIILFLIIINS